MTPKKLYSFVLKGDREGLCKALAKLDENQRNAIAADAIDLYRRVCKLAFGDKDKSKDLTDEERQFVGDRKKQKYSDWRVPRWTAALGVVGLCDEKTLLTSIGHDGREQPHRLAQILADRRPPWLASWLKKDLKEEEFARVCTWSVERALIKAGALPADSSDEHIARMSLGAPGFCGQHTETAVRHDKKIKPGPDSLADGLKADAELLENEVWRLFEVETQGFKYGWGEALTELSDAGVLDRERLLSASLSGMALPFRQGVLSEYGKFHEGLSPTIEEREALESQYLELLGSDHPIVIGAALKAIEAIVKEKRLSSDNFFDACSTVFRCSKKTQPRKAIKLIQKLVKQDGALATRATEVLAHGLGSEFPDVQDEALSAIERIGAQLSEAAISELKLWGDSSSAVLRDRIHALVESEANEAGEGVGTAKATGTNKPPKSDGKKVRGKTEDDPSSQATKNGSDLDPFPEPIIQRDVPRCDREKSVEPVGSLDELIELVSSFIEKCDDGMVVERILDGIARFYLTKPDDFDKRVAPLKKRIEKRTGTSGEEKVLGFAACIELAQLIRDWLDMPTVPAEENSWAFDEYYFLRYRVRQIGWRLRENRDRACGLLAFPSFRDGWIDPVALVERFKDYQMSSNDDWYLVENFDFAQAMLRLAPDRREEALQLIQDKSAREMRILRYALGGEVEELPEAGGLAGETVLLAAAHARSLTNDSGAELLSFPMSSVRFENGETQFRGPISNDMAFPSGLLGATYSMFPFWEWGPSWKNDFLVDCLNLTWPADKGPVCLYGVLKTRNELLKSLFDADLSFRDEQFALLTSAIGAANKETQGLVTDALVEAIGDHRMDPREFGRFLWKSLGSIKLNRLAAILDTVSKTSKLHHWSVFVTVDVLLEHLSETPRDLHYLLQVALESGTEVGKAVSPATTEFLAAIKGSNKTAKLAKQLLALEVIPKRLKQVNELAREVVEARAERWRGLRNSQ